MKALEKHIVNIKGIGLDMIFFLFWTIQGIKMLRVEEIGYNVEKHQKNYMKDISKVKNKVGNK